jgi:phosphoribosylpyrophosphate synthetase
VVPRTCHSNLIIEFAFIGVNEIDIGVVPSVIVVQEVGADIVASLLNLTVCTCKTLLIATKVRSLALVIIPIIPYFGRKSKKWFKIAVLARTIQRMLNKIIVGRVLTVDVQTKAMLEVRANT